jgi:hypothetical protein
MIVSAYTTLDWIGLNYYTHLTFKFKFKFDGMIVDLVPREGDVMTDMLVLVLKDNFEIL